LLADGNLGRPAYGPYLAKFHCPLPEDFWKIALAGTAHCFCRRDLGCQSKSQVDAKAWVAADFQFQIYY